MNAPRATASHVSPWREIRNFLILGVLPPGAPVLVFLFDLMGLCRGGMDSGVTCAVPFGGYFEGVSEYWELSMIFFGFGVVWFVAAVAIWVHALHWLLYVGAKSLGLSLPKPTKRSLLMTVGVLTLLAAFVTLS